MKNYPKYTGPGVGGLPKNLRSYDLFADLEDTIDRIYIDSCSEDGFTVNGIEYPGSIMVYPSLAFLWRPTGAPDLLPSHPEIDNAPNGGVITPDQITVESLALLKYVVPRPEILVVGTGSKHHHVPHIREFLDSLDISVEAMRTFFAIGTFNVLNMEGRRVAGIMLRDYDLT